VGAVYEEFERQLSEWSVLWADRPREQMLHLFLLALEREEIVAVGYREKAIERRLASMPIDDEAREIVRHALIWAWKDEEMHAIYIRGALLRLGNLRLKTKTYLRQLAGGIGGWASSVLMHTRWRDAPVSRFLASSITTVGSWFGSVPEEVKAVLEYTSFRKFCEFNIEAEKTAALCWRRIRELAKGERSIPPGLIIDFMRIELDEDRHAGIFEILTASFGEDDRLAPGVDAARLTERVRAVGEEFLPRRLRSRATLKSPLGSGAAVHVLVGAKGDDKFAQFERLLRDSGLLAAIDAQAERSGKTRGQMTVAIKPTFMLGYDRKDLSNITDPRILEALAAYLRRNGSGEVVAVESSNIYDEFYTHRSVEEVARYFGYSSPHYRLVDASQEQTDHQYTRGMAQYTVSRTWKEADFRISLGKMRSHPVELAYLTVSNVEWLGARCDEFLFCERQAQRETAIMMLLDAFPPHFAVLEAWDNVPDGLVGVMGCPHPKNPLRFYAGVDALAVDAVASRHMGMRNPRQSSILRAAYHWFGAAEEMPEVIGPDLPLAQWKGPYHSELSTLLSLVSYPVYVLGSGRGKLFVPEMDEKAFPPVERPSFVLRLTRRAIQTLIGLRHPR